MIANDDELQVTLDRVRWFQNQILELRKASKDLRNYRASSAGFMTEVDRMQREIREYLSLLPSEVSGAA